METITLHNVERGMCHASGTDEHGNLWTEFEVDHMAEQSSGECCICGAELEEGFMCMDGGEEICHDHVEYAEDKVFTKANVGVSLLVEYLRGRVFGRR